MATNTKHAGLCKHFRLTYTEVVRVENVRLVKIMILMSPSPGLDLDCQLSTFGAETDWQTEVSFGAGCRL